jgi:hypothetical protein
MLPDDIVAASTQVSIYRQLFFLTWVAAEQFIVHKYHYIKPQCQKT